MTGLSCDPIHLFHCDFVRKEGDKMVYLETQQDDLESLVSLPAAWNGRKMPGRVGIIVTGRKDCGAQGTPIGQC